MTFCAMWKDRFNKITIIAFSDSSYFFVRKRYVDMGPIKAINKGTDCNIILRVNVRSCL